MRRGSTNASGSYSTVSCLDADQFARGVFARRVDLDRLEFVAELEPAVRNPTLDVRRPGDQRFAVPEPDRLPKPLRYVGTEPRYDALLVEFAADMNLRDQGLGRVANVENEFRRHHETDARAAILREPAHEPFRPAVRTRPLRRVAPRVVIHLLDEALLVLRREQGQVGWYLEHGAVEPRGGLRPLAQIAAAPIGQRRLRIDRRTTAVASFFEQCGVVLLRCRKAIRADDLFSRVVAVAEPQAAVRGGSSPMRGTS